MSQPLQGVLQKEVSRKEFLGMSGLAIASIFGFGTLVKLLTGKSLSGARTHGSAYGSSYGASPYGGGKEG